MSNIVWFGSGLRIGLVESYLIFNVASVASSITILAWARRRDDDAIE